METGPSIPVVLETLTRATSQNTEILKPAEEQLKKWETEKGFYSTLLAIFSNHGIDLNVRWQAVIYFKNGVDRYWRKTAPNAIEEDEKLNLRTHLISNFSEPVNPVATQLAVLISKIARYDCPREWPALVPTLLEAVKSDEELLQHRALLTLHHVTKSLSSKRLAGDRRIFQELTSSIFRFILNLWDTHTDAFLQGEGNLATKLEKALLTLKVLRKLVVHGIKEPHKVQDAVLFINSVFNRLRTMLECRLRIQSNDQLRELSEKYIILLTKVLMDVLENHPFSYLQFITPSLQFTVTYLFTDEGSGKLFERFVIQCLNLIKLIILCAEYRPAKAAEVTKDPATLEAHRLKLEFFTAPTLVEICQRLISQYFPLTETDLAIWDSDPEGFATDEGGESWKFSLRPCTEVLFLSLFHEFRQILIPVLLQMMRTHVSPCEPSDIQTILYKDAVYTAVGLAAFDLFDEVDFDQWFSEILRKELEIKAASYKVIRRRVIWLVGQWVGVKLAPDLRPMLYETILRLLSSEEDLVVRLAAAGALKVAVDDFEFNTDQFLPFLQPTFSLLFQLLQQVSESDTKMNVLHVLSFIIERVGMAVQPYASALIHYLPLLWNESSDHNMLRCAILSTLVHLVQGLGPDSEKLYSFLLPVIQLSTDLSQPPSVYLLEDGLDLWLATLENAPVLHPTLLQLCPNVLPLLETTSESLKAGLQIIQAYILLAPNEFLQNFAHSIVMSCCAMITELRAEGTVMVLRLVEMVLKTLPVEGPLLFRSLLAFVFRSASTGKDYPMVLSMHLSVISRVLLNNQNSFNTILEMAAKDLGKVPETVLSDILDIWIDKMPLITALERRKLLGLALTHLLTWKTNIVTDRFCAILLAIVEVLNDIIKSDDIGSQVDSLVLTETDNTGYDSYPEDEPETEHLRRKKQLSFKDPVHTVVLKDYLHSQLMQLQQMLGSSDFQQLMQTVDIETMQQLQEYLGPHQ